MNHPEIVGDSIILDNTVMATSHRYCQEAGQRVANMVFEHQREHESQWAAIRSILEKIGCTPETLGKRVRQAEINQGIRDGLSASEREDLRQLKRENRPQALRNHGTHIQTDARGCLDAEGMRDLRASGDPGTETRVSPDYRQAHPLWPMRFDYSTKGNSFSS